MDNKDSSESSKNSEKEQEVDKEIPNEDKLKKQIPSDEDKDEDKLIYPIPPTIDELEYQKLHEELHLLKKPVYLKTGFIVAFAPVLLSLIGYLYTSSTGILDKLRDAELKELKSERTLLSAENERLDMKRDILEQQIRLFKPEKERLEKEKGLLADKYEKLDKEYKKKSQKLEAKHEKEILMLTEKFKEREKEQDKLIALRGKEVLVKKEETQALLDIGDSILGKTVDSSKQLQDAVGVLKQYAETLPKVKTPSIYSFEDWYNKGAGEFLGQKYDKAIASFTKALDKETDNDGKSYTLTYRGTAHAMNNEYDEALKDYKRSIEFKPNNPLPYINKGQIYIRRTEYKKAFDNFNKASEVFFSNREYGKGIKNITKTLLTIDKLDIDPETKTTIREEVEQLKKHLEKELEKILGGKVNIKQNEN